eukprot:5788083-Ditylum_brightwellii.AAC.1
MVLHHINKVRMYLGILILANITDNLGQYIRSWALTGSERAWPTLQWPNQEQPSPYNWGIWCNYFQTAFTKLPKYAMFNKN